MSHSPSLRVGIFVGGRGVRMGHVAKGLLRGPSGVPLIQRLLEQCELALPGAPRVLVGDASAYSELALNAVTDAPPGIGPLGGLHALLQHAALANEWAVIALACDMPFVSAGLLRRLATERPAALALAPRVEERWEPLCARYAVSALASVEAALQAGERSLQRVFTRLGEQAVPLELTAGELGELRDWDEPSDVRRDGA